MKNKKFCNCFTQKILLHGGSLVTIYVICDVRGLVCLAMVVVMCKARTTSDNHGTYVIHVSRIKFLSVYEHINICNRVSLRLVYIVSVHQDCQCVCWTVQYFTFNRSVFKMFHANFASYCASTFFTHGTA